MTRRNLTLGIVGSLAILLSGCLERKETIRVQRDGTVDYRIEVGGQQDDFLAGDRLPDHDTGWETDDKIEIKDDKKEQTREARLTVEPGQPQPDSFARSSDPAYAVSLKFPTELKIEKRPDGTYYHFKRTYLARESARYEYLRKVFEKSGKLKELSDKDADELTADERGELVGALQAIEAHKHAEFARAGADALQDEWPQHYGLLLRQAVLNVFVESDIQPILERLAEPQSEERDAAINDFGKRLVAQVRQDLREQLRELRVPRRQIEKFFAAYDQEEERRGVTEDLADENFEVRLELPGELVAHNADKVDDGALLWGFDGDALSDRDVVLMATSRVTD